MEYIVKQKDLVGGQEMKRLHRSTRNGTWLSAIPHLLSGIELSWKELRDNIRLI